MILKEHATLEGSLMKSGACAGQLRAVSDPRHTKHHPYPFTIRTFSREPNPLVMTGKLNKIK